MKLNRKTEEIELDQDGDAWLEWRSKGVGSSDVYLLFAEAGSFGRTAYGLWLDRTGYEKFSFETNEHTERGKLLEPVIRDKINYLFKTDFQPGCFLRKDAPHLRASLDGLDKNINAILEIKSPSDNVMKKYLSDWKIPDNYYYQIQYQMLVSNTDIAYYSFFNENFGEPRVMIIEADIEVQLEIEKRCALLWYAVENKIPIGWSGGKLSLMDIRPVAEIAIGTKQDRLNKRSDNGLPLKFDTNPDRNSFSFISVSMPEIPELITNNRDHKIEVVEYTESPFGP